MDRNNKPSSETPPEAGSSFGKACLHAVAFTRIGVGVGALIAPGLAWHLTGLVAPFTVSSMLMTRLFGSRDAVMGFALISALRAEAEGALSREKRESTRRIILIGFLVDMIDVFSVFGTAAYHGGIGVKAISLAGGGAIVFSAIGAAGLVAFP